MHNVQCTYINYLYIWPKWYYMYKWDDIRQMRTLQVFIKYHDLTSKLFLSTKECKIVLNAVKLGSSFSTCRTTGCFYSALYGRYNAIKTQYNISCVDLNKLSAVYWSVLIQLLLKRTDNSRDVGHTTKDQKKTFLFFSIKT